ncbi:PIN domain-containing protein [Natronospora cellulosivora (SeqCode)]
MVKNVMRLVLGVFGAIIGVEVVKALGIATEFSKPIWEHIDMWFSSTQFIAIIIGFLFGFFIISYLLQKLLQLIINFEHHLSWKRMVVGLSGLLAGLLIALFISLPFSDLLSEGVGKYLGILINLIFAYLGFSLFIFKEKELMGIFDHKEKQFESLYENFISNKILDTSVIIDGRIADICKSGFVEGTLVIPEFVLEELRHIADSSESLKRNRGRRGLDILKQMQKEPNIIVEIINQDFDDIQEVDSKLVKLAQIMDARVVTNDYNLNKVAELQGVRVLNINELANSVKPIVLPGEEMSVKVIKEGKEDGQGVAYLDDGTMIVVDDGIRYMNKKISVMVTSILQTAAGRMIFAKPKASKQIV